MGVETALAASAIIGTGASLYGQNKARKEAKKQNEQNRRDAILSEIMSIVSGKGPAGISPQQVSVPNVDYGGAISNLAQTGYQLNRQGIEDQRYEQQQQRQASLDAQAAAESAAKVDWYKSRAASEAPSVPVPSVEGPNPVPSVEGPKMSLNPFAGDNYANQESSVFGAVQPDVIGGLPKAAPPTGQITPRTMRDYNGMSPEQLMFLAEHGDPIAKQLIGGGGGGGPNPADPYSGFKYSPGGAAVSGVNQNSPAYIVK